MASPQDAIRALETDAIRVILADVEPGERSIAVAGIGDVSVATLRAELARRLGS